MQAMPPDWRIHGVETIGQDLGGNEKSAYDALGKDLFTNVARVALSCTCSSRIIHEGLLEKDINRGLVNFQSQRKFGFEMDFRFETSSLTLRSSPWVPAGPKRTLPGAVGSPPGVQRRKAGTDHGDGNTGRLPLWNAVEGVPREAWEWRTSWHPLPLYLSVRTDWSAKLTRGLG